MAGHSGRVRPTVVIMDQQPTMPAPEFLVLGPVRVRAAATDVPVRGARERAVLVRLLLDAGHSVPVATLVDDLWPPGNPSAERSLQVRVSSLRRDLAGLAELRRSGGGYQLDVTPAQVDAHRFERDLHAAEAAPPNEALQLTERALAAWQGAPLPDLAGLPAERLADRYALLYERARELHGTTLLALGRAAEAADVVTRLLDDSPLRESAAAVLVRALYADGRPANALEAHRTMLRRLADAGLDPTPELRALETAVLRHELAATRTDPTSASRPGHSEALRDPLLAESSAPASHEGRGPPWRGTPGPLLGRRTALRHVRRSLLNDRARLVTLWGPGGVGKTLLASTVVDAVASEFDDPPIIVDGTALTDSREVPVAVATAIGASMAGESPAELAAALAGRRCLLVFDNAEHLLGATPFLGELLEVAPALQLLVTSRVVLGIRTERVLQVDPLPIDAGPDGPDEGEIDALGFLMVRARDLAGHVPSHGDRESLVAVARLLDGVPLALELAAARMRLLSPVALRDQLVDTPASLGSLRDLPDRQRSLESVIAWSAAQLGPDARALLVQLGVFQGGARLDALQAVCDVPDVVAALAELVDHALVRRVETPDGEGAFTLLETVRRWARDALDEEDPSGVTRDRHADWFLGLAQRAAPELLSPMQRHWTLRLNEAAADLEQARRHFLVCGRLDEARSMILAIWRWRWGIGGWEMITRCLEQVCGPQSGDPGDRARVLASLAYALAEQGQTDAAAERAMTAMEVSRDIGDPLVRAEAISAQAWVEVNLGRPDEGLASFERAHALFQRAGADAYAAEALVRAGAVAAVSGDLGRGEELSRRALPVYEATGPHWELASLHNNLGHIALLRGDLDTAQREVDASLAIYDQLPSTNFRWSTFDTLARVRRARGDLDGARAAMERAVAEATRAGHRISAVCSHVEAAGIATDQGDLAAAGAHLQAATTDLPDVSPSYWRYVLVESARTVLACGDRAHATRLAAAAGAFPPDGTLLPEERFEALLAGLGESRASADVAPWPPTEVVAAVRGAAEAVSRA